MTKEEIEACERTFEVDVDVFGTPTSVELVEGGSKVALTYSNRRDYLFNKSCAKQLEAFQQGFDRICCDSIIKMFRPEELDLLICGSPDLDFDALESSATYDGGYTMETPIIRYFWETVREFSDEQKKKLLFFATGSDRVPVGGLGKLHFVIAKNGGDSDRLPTSHTCFNVLLLPEYSTKEKLVLRLTTAIHNAEGFGMI
ncbi:hypothetical protein EV182_002669 [Spiromyces aspiralis]|uniref:Uncharacterized protein n=1 Tax=Spiromyces aspiralis TaxID=68401 RepID=A0ACC1HS59_9FUNG|nr:hypothetical protein EV182_002669 [Spiromyces aspiralis]